MKRRNFLIAGALDSLRFAFLESDNLYSYDNFEEERSFAVPPIYENEIIAGKRVFNLKLQKGEFIKVNIKNDLGYESIIHMLDPTEVANIIGTI